MNSALQWQRKQKMPPDISFRNHPSGEHFQAKTPASFFSALLVVKPAKCNLSCGNFQSESRIGKSAGDFLAVFFCHARFAGNVVPFASDLLFHLIDYYSGLVRLKEETCALRQQIPNICVASPIATIKRQVTTLGTDRRGWRQIIGW